MQNINVLNFTTATNFDINNIAEFLLGKAIRKINIDGRITDGDTTDFIVYEEGFEVVYGSMDTIDEVMHMIDSYNGVSLLKAEIKFNQLKYIYEVVIQQMARTIENDDNHIVTASIKHNGDFIYFADITKVRDVKV